MTGPPFSAAPAAKLAPPLSCVWVSLAFALATVGIMAAPVAARASQGASASTDPSRNPSSNFPVSNLPMICGTQPRGTTCLNVSVRWLDRARAHLGQPPYRLPRDFDALGPRRQLLILVNDDRILYGLAPVPGLSRPLTADAAQGVLSDSDPWPTGRAPMGYASNWAVGFENVVLAYEAWMYDDGYHSSNIGCGSPGAAGCWSHRHVVLWRFPDSRSAAMGADAGLDSAGCRGFSLLIVQYSPGSRVSYTLTWRQVLAAWR